MRTGMAGGAVAGRALISMTRLGVDCDYSALSNLLKLRHRAPCFELRHGFVI
jgi:hypothetical protein